MCVAAAVNVVNETQYKLCKIFGCSIRVYCSLSTLLEGHSKHLEGPEYNVVLVISLLGINENCLSLYSTSIHLGYVNDFKCSMLITITIYLAQVAYNEVQPLRINH